MQRLNNRGQTAITIARFFLSLGVGAIVYWIMSLVTTPILNRSMNATTNATANQATQWFSTFVGYMPIIFAGISFFGVIAYAVFIREVNR